MRTGAFLTARYHRGAWTAPRYHPLATEAACIVALDALAVPRRRVVLYAYRLGDALRELDALAALPRAGWRLERGIVEDPPTILRWRRGTSTVLMLDTRNYGIDLLDSPGGPFGWECRQPGGTAVVGPPSTDGAVFLAWRTLLAVRELLDLWRRADAGTIGPTLASSAMHAYRHRHLTTRIVVDDDPRALALARAAYVGGRCEAYQLGTLPAPVAHVDVRSMYPALMRDAPMPVRLAGVYRSVAAADLATLAADTAAVADVTVDTEEARFPVRVGRRVRYLAGRQRVVLAPPELHDAARLGLIVRVHRTALYDAEPIFRSWVDEWYGRRLDAERRGDLDEAAICKRVLNALTGKWGQVGSTLEAVGPADPSTIGAMRELDLDTGDVYEWRTVGGYSSWRLRRGETRDSHPAIAATITSLGRRRLWELMAAVAPEPVYYVDTDALLTTEAGALLVSRAAGSAELGAPRLVGLYQAVQVRGRRNYDVDQRPVVAGLPRGSTRVGAERYQAERRERLPVALARGDLRPVPPRLVELHLR